MKRSTVGTGFALILGLGLSLILVWLLSGKTVRGTVVPKNPSLQVGGIITVCLGGGCDYATIQAAVDFAGEGDVVKVAQGTYNDIHVHDGITQVVYISKTVAIQGGYTTTNWAVSYPITQPTILDAQGQGRVLYITGDISPAVEGLHITGGNATGLRGNPWGTRDVGSGVYIVYATATISNNQIFSNTAANQGGGFYLWSSPAILTSNTVSGNSATHAGGGLYLYQSDNATLISNTVFANTANDYGGGLYLHHSSVTLSGNSILSNTAFNGGGLYLYDSDNVTLGTNTISDNSATDAGGGLYLSFSDATLNGNTVTFNTTNNGGGLHLWSSDATLNDNTIAFNIATGDGG
ncbi:MAG: NosD domain-containing protein, partial [Anaerolineae bacterium]